MMSQKTMMSQAYKEWWDQAKRRDQRRRDDQARIAQRIRELGGPGNIEVELLPSFQTGWHYRNTSNMHELCVVKAGARQVWVELRDEAGHLLREQRYTTLELHVLLDLVRERGELLEPTPYEPVVTASDYVI